MNVYAYVAIQIMTLYILIANANTQYIFITGMKLHK